MAEELVVKNYVFVGAPASKVWDALVNPAMTRKYMFDCEAISEWKVGSSLIWKGAVDGKVYVKGTVLKIEPGRLLQYTTFDPNGKYQDVPSNYLTVDCVLSEERDGTKLAMTQGDFAGVENGQKRYEETIGGWGMILQKIKEIAEEKSSPVQAK